MALSIFASSLPRTLLKLPKKSISLWHSGFPRGCCTLIAEMETATGGNPHNVPLLPGMLQDCLPADGNRNFPIG